MRMYNAIALGLVLGTGLICAMYIVDEKINPAEGVIQSYDDLKNSTDNSPLVEVGSFLNHRFSSLSTLKTQENFNAILFNFMVDLWTAHNVAEQVLETNPKWFNLEKPRLFELKNHLAVLLKAVKTQYPLASVYSKLIESAFETHGQLSKVGVLKFWQSKDEQLFNKYLEFNAYLKSPGFWTVVNAALATSENIAQAPALLEMLAASLRELHLVTGIKA